MKYIDFHTHSTGCEKYLNDDSVIVVQSLHLQETIHPRADFATMGVHPMLSGANEVLQQYQEAPDQLINEWMKHIKSSPTPIIGLGECGWDHRSTLPVEAQNQLMDFHLQLAERLRLPIVFHIVGGWHHLLQAHRRATTPWVVHGFRGKPQLALQLTQAGINLSLHPLVPTPPTGNYLLETDEALSHIKTQYELRGANREEKFNLFSKLFLP